MTTPPDPMRITSIGRSAAATVAFASGGQLRVTAIVKATFALVPDGPMALIAPVPVVRDDEPAAGQPSRSLAAAAETAPYLARTDVVVTGSARAPGALPTPRLMVRVIVVRDGRPLLDKSLFVQGPVDASGQRAPIAAHPVVYEAAVGGPGFPDNPVGAWEASQVRVVHPQHPGRPAGFGPIARSWPVRRQLLGSFDPRQIEQRIAILPDGFPWGYFQAAPPDQRTPALRGDEWFVLEGFHADRPRLQSQLPGAFGAARLYGSSGDLVSGAPIAMVADMAILDADRGTCAIVWRGSFPVTGEEALGALEVHAGVGMPGQPIAFPSSRPAAVASPPPPPPRKHRVAATLSVEPENVDRGKDTALPFRQIQRADGAAPRAPVEKRSRQEATLTLSLEDLAKRSDAPLMPFTGGKPAAEPVRRSVPLPPATPFERVAGAAPSPPVIPAFQTAPAVQTVPAVPTVLPASALHHSTAPVAVAPFEPPPPLEITYAGGAPDSPGPEEEPLPPGPLGASFLAAAARAGLAPVAPSSERAGSP